MDTLGGVPSAALLMNKDTCPGAVVTASPQPSFSSTRALKLGIPGTPLFVAVSLEKTKGLLAGYPAQVATLYTSRAPPNAHF